ncbi:MAG: choice-of-anchor S family protein [Candidatus Heimdallarchaeota archaeon]
MNANKTKITLLLLIFTVCTSCTFVSAEFTELNEDSTYTYNITNSTWTLNTSSNNAHGTGLQFLGKQFSIDSRFTVKINYISQYYDRVNYRLAFLNDYVNVMDTNDSTAIYSLTHLHAYILIIDNIWDQTKMEMGPHLLCPFFFFDLKSFNETFSQGANFDQIAFGSLGFSTWSAAGIEIFEEQRNTHLFGFSYNFTYSKKLADPTNQTDFIYQDYCGIFKIRIEYDSKIGVLKGYNLLLDSSGIHNNESVSYHIEQTISAKGFDIGDFEEFEEVPGFTVFVSISAFVVIGTTSVMIKRRKRKI